MNYMRIIFKKFKARMIVGCILAVIALLAVSVIVFINQASFGRTPRGERQERVMISPNKGCCLQLPQTSRRLHWMRIRWQVCRYLFLICRNQ